MLTSFPADSASALPAAPVPVSTGGPAATDAAPATPPVGFADLLASFAPAPEAAPLPAVPVDTAPSPSSQLPPPLPVFLWQFSEQLTAPVPTQPAAKPPDNEPESPEVDEIETSETPLAKIKTPDIDPAFFFRPSAVVPPTPALKLESSDSPDAPVDTGSFRAVAFPVPPPATPARPSAPSPAPLPTPALSVPVTPTPTTPTLTPPTPTLTPSTPESAAAPIPAPAFVPHRAAPESTARNPAAFTLPPDVNAPPSAAPAQISAPVPTGSSDEGEGTPFENKNNFQTNDNNNDASAPISTLDFKCDGSDARLQV